MQKQKADILHSIGTALCIFLFLLLTASFSDASSTQSGAFSTNHFKSDTQLSELKALPVKSSLQLSLKRNYVPVLYTLFNVIHRSMAYSHSIYRQYVQYCKINLTEPLVMPCQFYYLLCSRNADDVPALS
ncbi:MAG: hypothetical protein V2A54_08155 [Bacteroidota bacterium]